MAKYYQLTISVSLYEFNRFKELKTHGFSAREVLELSNCLCDKCRGGSVIVYDKNTSEQVEIPKGILSKRK